MSGVHDFIGDDPPEPDESGRKKKAKRTLDWLPDYGASHPALRLWITTALGFPEGWLVEDFIRFGRQRNDPCALVVTAPGGGLREFRFSEQRLLSTPASLRSTVLSETDGIARMRALNVSEREEVWAALCTLARVTVKQTAIDETHDWIDRFLRVTSPTDEHTLEPVGRFEALKMMRSRPEFGRAAALRIDELDGEHRPVLLVDRITHRQYIRAGDFATYLRHVIGVGPLSQSTLDGRVAEIDIEAITFEARRGTEHPRVTAYRLPVDGTEAAEEENTPDA